MTRKKFGEIFIQYPDGTIEPRQRIHIGGVSLGPGVRFSKGAMFAGVDFFLFINHDFEVEEKDGELIILGIYQ